VLNPAASAYHQRGFNNWVNGRLDTLTRWYRALVGKVVGRGWLLAVAMVTTFVASGLLFKLVPSELAPPEDRGSFQVSLTGPEGAGYDYTVQQVQQAEQQRLADGLAERAAVAVRQALQP